MAKKAAASASAKKSTSKKSSTRSSGARRSSGVRRSTKVETLPGTKIQVVRNLTPFEQECINFVQAIIEQNKLEIPGTYKHVGHAVAAAYENAHVKNPQCSDFYTAEKSRKLAEREERKKAKEAMRKAKRLG